MKMKCTQGEGDRYFDCRFYNECLDRAGLLNYKSWNCEGCDFYGTVFGKRENKMNEKAKKPENARICGTCEKNITIQPSSPYCASCLSLKAKESRARKKEAIKTVPIIENGKQGGSMGLRKGKEAYLDKDQAEISQPRTNFKIIFKGKYSQLLKELEKVAEEEVRTVDEQIVYIIKTYLSNTQHPEVSKQTFKA